MRRFARLGCLGALGSVVALACAEWWLARRAGAGSGPDPAVRTEVLVRAPLDRVWAELADLEGQTRWMHDAKTIRVLTPGPVRAGTLAEADVRIFGIGTTDPIEIEAWDPPRRFAIDHRGAFKGRGEMTLTEGHEPGTTLVVWRETLLPPVLPMVSANALRPILRRVFQADLDRLAALAESGADARS